jgi:hypothetical protein
LQGFSGEQVDGQTRRQTEGEQNCFHAVILPDAGKELSAAGQRFVKKM